MRLIDADELRRTLSDKDYITYTQEYGAAIPVDWVIGAIDNAETIEREEIAYTNGYTQGTLDARHNIFDALNEFINEVLDNGQT